MGRPLVARNLIDARKAAGFETASAACNKFGWNENTLRGHEAGTREPGRNCAVAYAEAYGVSVEQLFGERLKGASKRWARKQRTDGITSAAEARNLFAYEPDTGNLIRKVGRSPNAKAGDVAGAISQGYLQVNVHGRLHKAHRIIWLIQTGEWPTGVIDHINGNGLDNRWCNLRDATRSQNQANMKRPKHNKSGVKGVRWDHRQNRWVASISFGNENRVIGAFIDMKEAAAAYRAEATRLFGEFARFE